MKITVHIKGVSPPEIIMNVIASADVDDSWYEVRTATKVYRFLRSEVQWTVEEP